MCLPGQRQLQDETRIVYFLWFGASYIIDFTVFNDQFLYAIETSTIIYSSTLTRFISINKSIHNLQDGFKWNASL